MASAAKPTPATGDLAIADSGPRAEVYPLAGIDRALTYGVPARLDGEIRPGHLVRVPLGRRTLLGIVKRLVPETEAPVPNLKNILERLYDEPVMTPSLLALADWLGRYYACGFQSVLETMVPAVVRQGVAPKETKLLKIGYPLPPDEFAKLEKRAPKQAALLAFLRDQARALPKTDVLSRLGVSAQSCKSLADKGLVFEVREVEQRTAYEDELGEKETAVSTEAPQLTEEQAAAVEELRVSLGAGGFITHLLHGVTGSGKTEVYLRILEDVLAQGGSAIYLVPEVALTPQTVARVRGRLSAAGHQVVVWHSHLSAGERVDAWRAMATGAARVVVGARSAVFAPLADVRLIIVDEEHEPSYKQSESPRYHGRDVAVYRAKCEGALALLGSATPALETLYHVSTEHYRCTRLTRRVDDRKLPDLYIVDMTKEKPSGKGQPRLLSTSLAERLRDRFEKREQSILFLNRRGFATSLLCPECGYNPECPHCSVTLTYHRVDERLKCHLCGHHERAPQECPACGSAQVRRRGHGTQRIEDAVRTLLPTATCVRLDADAMSKKNLFRRVLQDFR
ncbi:MAG: primosomal protein N', partial [Opitutales bacterium]